MQSVLVRLAARKRRKDPNPDRKGKAINVKTESKIYESHKEIASGKKKDREGYMARTQLDTINKAVVSLKKNIKKVKIINLLTTLFYRAEIDTTIEWNAIFTF